MTYDNRYKQTNSISAALPTQGKKLSIAQIVVLTFVAVLFIGALSGCAVAAPFHGIDVKGDRYVQQDGYSAEQAYEALCNANEIVLQKEVVNLDGDHWEIYADGEHVADITGDMIAVWDVYRMRSTNGDVMFSEEENLSFITADATKFDSNDTKCGKYHQNITFLFLDITFYDDSDNETGSLHQKLGFTLQLDIKDKDGNVNYHADKDFISWGSRIAIVKKTDNTQVAPEDAIFGTVIANEISQHGSGGGSKKSAE